MPITRKTNDRNHYFIFCGKDILIEESAEASSGAARSAMTQGAPLLPGHEVFDRLAATNLVNDTMSEIPENYAAMVLNPKCGENALELLSGAAKSAQTSDKHYRFITLREFCFRRPDLAPSAKRAKGLSFWHDTYRHCPKCGAPFTEDKAETALLCPSCSFKLYPRIEPCAIVLVHRGDEILLVKNKHSGAKFFSCIAGFIELGETAVDAVHREVMEEVGLKIKNVRALGSQSWPFPDQLMLAFSAEYESGELVLQEDEIAEARWFKKDALPPKELLAGEGSVAWNMIFDRI